MISQSFNKSFQDRQNSSWIYQYNNRYNKVWIYHSFEILFLKSGNPLGILLWACFFTAPLKVDES
jgi:hypothetical protein